MWVRGKNSILLSQCLWDERVLRPATLVLGPRRGSDGAGLQGRDCILRAGGKRQDVLGRRWPRVHLSAAQPCPQQKLLVSALWWLGVTCLAAALRKGWGKDRGVHPPTRLSVGGG